MPTLVDLTPVVTAARYAAGLYAVTATVLTTACLTLHLVTRVDRFALRRRTRRPVAERPLFVPLEGAASPT